MHVEPAIESAQAALVWLRRDLRCDDHAALYYALRHFKQVHCLFVFDTEILDALPAEDRRVRFIHACVQHVHRDVQALAQQHGIEGSGVMVRYGRACQVVAQVAQQLGVQAVLANRDYEPDAMARDEAVAQRLQQVRIRFHTCKDHVLLERDELLNQQGKPYSVFTPYKKAWLKKLDALQRKAYPVAAYAQHLVAMPAGEVMPSLSSMGFVDNTGAEIDMAGSQAGQRLLAQFLPKMAHYQAARDFPAQAATSKLSVHLRFGTVSIRQVATLAWQQAQCGDEGAQTWLAQLAWRDFYVMVLWHRPDVVDHSYRPAYDGVQWDDTPQLWAAWCEGRTGYPFVDAAMRQLNQTGWMHNRLRMVVASFLTKDLGIDWRRGERYFAQQLLDYDLAANNGGWQWAASTGCDAQPWFRIFNPITQSQRFDPQGAFIRQFVPELAQVPDQHIHFPSAMKPQALQDCGVALGHDYPEPVVIHSSARQRTLMRFHFLSAASSEEKPKAVGPAW